MFKKMVDVCGGKMTLEQLRREIEYYMLEKRPKRLIVDIKLRRNGYHATIYMDKEDFEKEAKR